MLWKLYRPMAERSKSDSWSDNIFWGCGVCGRGCRDVFCLIPAGRGLDGRGDEEGVEERPGSNHSSGMARGREDVPSAFSSPPTPSPLSRSGPCCWRARVWGGGLSCAGGGGGSWATDKRTRKTQERDKPEGTCPPSCSGARMARRRGAWRWQWWWWWWW